MGCCWLWCVMLGQGVCLRWLPECAVFAKRYAAQWVWFLGWCWHSMLGLTQCRTHELGAVTEPPCTALLFTQHWCDAWLQPDLTQSLAW
jgi:hypothetical protein